jgi:hypothetical protein
MVPQLSLFSSVGREAEDFDNLSLFIPFRRFASFSVCINSSIYCVHILRIFRHSIRSIKSSDLCGCHVCPSICDLVLAPRRLHGFLKN